MVSMRSDARVPVPRSTYVCTYACVVCTRACVYARVGRFLMRARVRRTRPHTRSSRQRWEERDGGGSGARRGRTGCTGVNYASREMSNCSPYRKIYNSARCGKHYVLGPFSSSPLAAPVVPTFNHPRVSQPLVHPLTRAFPTPASLFLARFSPPRARSDRHDSQINSRGAPQSY